MVSDEPFTVRTVVVTTAISLLAMFAMVAVGVQLGAAWLLAGFLNVGLAFFAGIGLQFRHYRQSGPQSAEVA